MENNLNSNGYDLKMGNWNINFRKGKKSEVKRVQVYTNTMKFMIVIFWLLAISLGIWLVVNSPQSGARYAYMAIAFILPGSFVIHSFKNPRKKLIEITNQKYLPDTPIDLDRYVIAMNTLGLEKMVPKQYKEDTSLYSSNFQEHRRLRRKQRFSMFRRNKKIR